jgi:hypothetical protein
MYCTRLSQQRTSKELLIYWRKNRPERKNEFRRGGNAIETLDRMTLKAEQDIFPDIKSGKLKKP